VKLYGRRFADKFIKKNIRVRSETRDAVLWDIDWANRICKVKVQGSNEQIAAHFPQNEAIHPNYMRLGNAVRIVHKGGVRGHFEVVGHGMALPTPVSGDYHPPEADLVDGLLSGGQVTAAGDLTVEIADGTYRIDGTTYVLSGDNFGFYTMDDTDPITMADPYAPATMGDAEGEYTTMTDTDPEVMNEVVPPMTMGSVGTYVLDDPPTGNKLRYDCFYVGTDGIITYLKGAAASSSPTKPSIPADTVMLGEYILVWTGLTEITQANIGMDYLAEYPTSVEITAVDEFDWDGGDDTPEKNVTATVYNQYGWAESGLYIMTLTMQAGTGQIYGSQTGWDNSEVEQQVSGSAYTFKYQRDQTILETCPFFVISVTNAAGGYTLLNSHRIVLYDEFGAEVLGTTITVQSENQTLTPGATVAVDWDKGHIAEIEMDQDITFTFSLSPSEYETDKLILIIDQDSTGGWTPTLPASVEYGNEITEAVIDEAANKRSYLGFFYNRASENYDLVANVSGYSNT